MFPFPLRLSLISPSKVICFHGMGSGGMKWVQINHTLVLYNFRVYSV